MAQNGELIPVFRGCVGLCVVVCKGFAEQDPLAIFDSNTIDFAIARARRQMCVPWPIELRTDTRTWVQGVSSEDPGNHWDNWLE